MGVIARPRYGFAERVGERVVGQVLKTEAEVRALLAPS